MNHSRHGDAASKDGTLYVCPMHPEIRQDHPGRCPKCQMHLVPQGQPEDQAAHAYGGHDAHQHHGHGKRHAGHDDVTPGTAPNAA
jgi:Cu+-exporting ATPase